MRGLSFWPVGPDGSEPVFLKKVTRQKKRIEKQSPGDAEKIPKLSKTNKKSQ